MVPRQRVAENTGRYGGRLRQSDPVLPAQQPAPAGLLQRAVAEYVSGAAFCAGFLTVAALTYAVISALWL